MRRVSAIVRVPGGRRAKWAVLVFWLLVVAVAGPLSGKLMGAEKNDAKAWLPANAESTKVLDLQSKFQSPNVFTAVMGYDPATGPTAAGPAKAGADARGVCALAGGGGRRRVGP